MALQKGQVVKTIRGHLYLYQRYPFWNKEKKKKDDKWKSLGRCDEHGNLLQPAVTPVEAIHSSTPVGALAVFWAAAQELNIMGTIRKVLPDPQTARIVLLLAINQVTGRRPLDAVPSWFQETPLPRWLGLDADVFDRSHLDAALSSLCHEDEYGTTRDQGLLIQHELTRAWRGRSREPAQFFYDITKTVYHGSKCALAEPGYHPGGTRKNVVGFGLVTSRQHHHPVLCRAINGSRSDTLTIDETINELHAFGFKGLLLTTDRGMVSQANMETIRNGGYHQIGIVPATHTKAWEQVAKYTSDELEQSKYVVMRPSGPVYARGWNTDLMGKKVHLVIVVDPMRRAKEQAHRDELLHDAQTTTDTKRLKQIRHALGSIAKPSKGRRGWTIDDGLAKEDRKGDGRYLLFSTDTSLSAQEMVDIYSQRESIEHAFRTTKGDLILEPLRYHRPDRIHAYSTIIYIGWLLWSWVERTLRQKYPDLTLHKALETLEKVHLVQFSARNKRQEWVTRPNKEQEELLKHLNSLQLLNQGPGC